MINVPGSQNSTRLLLTETIWLEPEQVEQANALSNRTSNELSSEAQSWQHYLSTLALVGFEQWLEGRLPEQSIERSPSPLSQAPTPIFYLQVDGFIICLITVEHVLDETVRIPQAVIEEPTQAAHFYVLNEVSEEQGLVTVRGFLRFDELIQYRDRHRLQPENGHYQLPLTALDVEPNHLPLYCRLLEPSAIALPVNISSRVTNQVVAVLTKTTTVLTQWLQNTFDDNWQTIDQLINPDAYLSFSTRNITSGIERGRLVNFGLQLDQQTVALLMNVRPEADQKFGILVQLHPTGATPYLIPGLKLSLRSSTGQILQEVVSRSQDNYIQLKPFKGRAGTRFSVVIHFGNEMVEENFEL